MDNNSYVVPPELRPRVIMDGNSDDDDEPEIIEELPPLIQHIFYNQQHALQHQAVPPMRRPLIPIAALIQPVRLPVEPPAVFLRPATPLVFMPQGEENVTDEMQHE